MPPPSSPTLDAPNDRRGLPGLLAGAAIVIVTMLLLGAGDDRGLIGPVGVLVAIESGWPAVLWMLAAAGLGHGVARLLGSTGLDADKPGVRDWAIGVALLLAVDLGLGWSGFGTNRVLLGSITLGLAAMGVWSFRDWRPGPPGVALAAAIPIGTMTLAAASVPGWLWETEFGGYDALSYHLQLPREWWLAGAIIETPHNAYGYLPNGVEAAFLHLNTLVGDPNAAARSGQILAMLLVLGAAFATGELATTLLGDEENTGPDARRLAFVALLATPWIVVVGSLAYDEPAVLMLGAAAFTVIFVDRTSGSGSRLGITLGLLLGGAVLAKASSGLLLLPPVALAAAIILPTRRWPVIILWTAITGVGICLPWLLRNWSWTGNPVFPFGTGLLGRGEWTSAQVDRFNLGHQTGFTEGLRAIATEFLVEDWWRPSGVDPWRPQWVWLPIVGLVSMITIVRSRVSNRRGAAMLAATVAMVLLWAFLTHAKARFLLPVAPLLAAATAALASRTMIGSGRPVRVGVIVTAWTVSLIPAIVLGTERFGNPTAAIENPGLFDGGLESKLMDAVTPARRRELMESASPAWVLNHGLDEDARVLLVGRADPFHFGFRDETGGSERLSYQTVWTRGPLERILERIDPDLGETARAEAALEALAAAGYSHLYIDRAMLDRWRDAGWSDPLLSAELVEAIAAGRPPVAVFGTRGFIVRP
ncbi:MAG: hypothetical protein CMJ27_04675 [Phycisphaerae bacterium]|nr:hypothetical protein [Phycisphaerae bacterium]OUX02280.1 MAG: hypothetical protein CBD91_02785 [Phycisphaeraceae bacterium TMED231]